MPGSVGGFAAQFAEDILTGGGATFFQIVTELNGYKLTVNVVQIIFGVPDNLTVIAHDLLSEEDVIGRIAQMRGQPAHDSLINFWRLLVVPHEINRQAAVQYATEMSLETIEINFKVFEDGMFSHGGFHDAWVCTNYIPVS